MGGDVETIKERLDIAEIVSQYLTLEKAGQSFKARCPFHNEKTPSFHVSPQRQSFYCFGCGAKGDIFTFVEQVEGLDFREALKLLADKAGVELSYNQSQSKEQKTEKDKIHEVLEEATKFFVSQLEENIAAKDYLQSRGISAESVKSWKLGYAPAEWRSLYAHLLERGYPEEILIKAGLVKRVEAGSGKNPYDVFRDRLIFPLRDTSGRVIAFSGRALSKDTEPKYLNSPDTRVFTKHEVLYGLDIAKDKIRRKDYAVLVEGQIDLVLSHQVGVDNTIASSGTAFTQTHLERLKKLSKRIILAFDADTAGEKAAEKSTELAMLLGLEVKIAKLPDGQDPAEVAKADPNKWKELLREAKPAVEHFLSQVMGAEKEPRKLGKLIEKKILPYLTLLESSIERSHFVSLIAKRTGIKEELIWDDLRRAKRPSLATASTNEAEEKSSEASTTTRVTRREQLEERLTELRLWLKEVPENAKEAEEIRREEAELENHLTQEILKEALSQFSVALAVAEMSKDANKVEDLMQSIKKLHTEIQALEKKKAGAA